MTSHDYFLTLTCFIRVITALHYNCPLRALTFPDRTTKPTRSTPHTHFFLYQTKYIEAKRSVYTKEGGHFGGLLTQAGGISYSTVYPAVHFRYSSGPGREGVKLNQRCPPS